MALTTFVVRRITAGAAPSRRNYGSGSFLCRKGSYLLCMKGSLFFFYAARLNAGKAPYPFLWGT